MNIQIQSSGFNADIKLVELINQKIDKLTKFHDKIIDVVVHMTLDNHKKVKDKVVRLKCHIPNHTLFAESTAKSFEIAVAETTDDLTRQIKKKKDIMKDKNQKEKSSFKR